MDEKEVEDNYSAHQPTAFAALDPTDQNAAAAAAGGGIEMVDYMLNTSPAPPPPHLSFAEVMQFADFRPKIHAQPQTQVSGDVVDVESCFFKFPSLPSPSPLPYDEIDGGEDQDLEEEEAHRFSDLNAAATATATAVAAGSSVQEIGGSGADQGKSGSRRKRGRSMKTSEEVESQRMTHIAVERNRRRQMNEHLRVLRALMPTSYVQRGDQASIIGGAIEFVRELEQLLQCLESQKRRRLYGSGAVDASLPLPMPQPPQPLPPFFPQLPLAGVETSDGSVGLREDMAENKSPLADIEVRLLGLDAMIKILSRRRPGQLLRTIAALEDMQLSILHTNITTIEQTVLYSFNVKITAETTCTAQEMANSVQQILGFIDDSREHY
ncbi:hypothetical protein KFK09_005480 [Dendrobium nobile]|uniref:BHLH domain-containing protein n=1 Tax=Dendrobium nobile TaxID=94219 RepID=A0A8T3BVS6_DENNO|nr:hypothetical protein KFK09_005480 [Dendrobium nobile]